MKTKNFTISSLCKINYYMCKVLILLFQLFSSKHTEWILQSLQKPLNYVFFKDFLFVKGYLWRRCKPSCWGWSGASETSSAAVWEVLWKKPTASPAWTHPVGQCWLVACEGKQPACRHRAVILQKRQNGNCRIIFVTWNSHVQTLW